MLIQQVNRICAEIEARAFHGLSELAEQIQEAAPDAVADLVRQNQARRKPTTEEAASKSLALIAHTGILSMPRSARAMLAKINDRRLSAAQRCAMASILAYLVQPHDLIPDDAPGGYGYLDDAILVQAGLVEYLDTLPAEITNAESQQRLAAFLVNLAPQHVRPQIQLAVGSLSTMVQLLAMAGDDAEGILQFIIANPLANQNSMSVPRGFAPHAPRDYGGGFFGRSGAWVEGDNIVMPGGGGLINGELFIP